MVTHLPDDRSDSAGAEAIALAELAGLHLDEWQRWCLTESLSESTDGQWSAFEVAVLVGRQNGKGTILEARQLVGLFLLHERLQVHTAHEFKTCFEHFLRVVQLIESTPELDARVARIRRGAGEQAIELKSGERLRFLARSSGSGRGLSGDAVYLDEAFALTPQMMGALLPTLSARPNPQVWYMSSAPMSTSSVLHGVLKRGTEGTSDRLFMANWGHLEGVDIDDVDNWYLSNPSLGIRISEESIRAEREALSGLPDEFARERCGVPEPLPVKSARDVKLPAERWAETVVGDSPDIGPGEITISYDVDIDSASASIAIGAGSVTDPYVEVIEHRRETGWVPARLVELVRKWQPTAVGFNGAGPAGAMVGPVHVAFREAGISSELLVALSSVEYRQACAGFYTDVIEGRLTRPGGQGPLDVAAGDATDRTIGEGWGWDRRSSSVPVSPLVAVTIARALLPTELEEVPVEPGFFVM